MCEQFNLSKYQNIEGHIFVIFLKSQKRNNVTSLYQTVSFPSPILLS